MLNRAPGLLAERSIADAGFCLSDFMVLEALLHKGPLTIGSLQGELLKKLGRYAASGQEERKQ